MAPSLACTSIDCRCNTHMARPRPGTHRNPGRRPPGLYQDGAGAEPPEAPVAAAAADDAHGPQQGAELEAAAAAAEQQMSEEAASPEDAPTAAEAADDAAPPLPLPHMPPNHHARGKRPSGLVLPTDVHLSIDGTPLPPPSAISDEASTSVSAGDAAAAAAGGEAGVALLPGGRLPPGEISFHTVCAFATSVAKCKGAGCMERKRKRVTK